MTFAETYEPLLYIVCALSISVLVWVLAFQNTHSSVLLGKTTHGQSRPAKIIDALESPARISFENDPETAAPTLLALADADQMSLAPVVMITGDLPGNTVGPLENLGNDDQTRYIVRDGDTLADIAEIFDISVSTIKNANEKETKSKIKTGMELVIPPMDGLPYTILKGDTFGGIAKKFNIDADDIADFNYILDRTSLVAGTTIFIPNGKPLPEIKAAPTRSSSSSSNKGVGLSFSGSLGKPVNGPITSGYGMRSGGMHKGMDFGAPIGTPVYAAGSGYVKKASAGYNGGFGTMVVIGHSSYDTLYAHMSRTTTTTGAYVAKGQVIGYSGNTGRSTGPHLHFEVRVGGKPVNPTSYLR